MYKAVGSPKNKRPHDFLRYSGGSFADYIADQLDLGSGKSRSQPGAASPRDRVVRTSALYDLAISGDVQAIKVWLDHVAGRAPQAIEHSGKAEIPRTRVVVVEDNGRPTRPPLGKPEEPVP
jgi:hypothetical protein